MIDPREVPEPLVGLADALSHDREPIRISRDRVPERNTRTSAVLIMVGLDDLDITFTERAHTLRSHPGQISFPGGRTEEGENPEQTALREAHEEVGVQPADLSLLGRLPRAHVPTSGFDVFAVVASWQGSSPIGAVDNREVEAVHRFRVADLVDPANRVTATLPSGYRGPAFVFGELVLWGFTAALTDRLLDLGGWSRPWDSSRLMPVPRRFIQDGRGPR